MSNNNNINNVPSFNIPSLIPPLPSSSRSSGISSLLNNKENTEHNKPAETKSLRNGGSSSSSSSSSKRSPHQTNNNKPLPTVGLQTPPTTATSHATSTTTTTTTTGSVGRHLGASPSPGTSVASNGSTTTTAGSSKRINKRRNVLRFGETTEVFFCITSQSNREHRRLARGIADGSLADNPQAWRQVVQLASQQSTDNNNNNIGTDLIRLHRRATLRFPLGDISDSTRDDILQIWLSFTAIHVQLGMMDEARRTWRYIENQKIPLGASYYVQVAGLEAPLDIHGACDILQKGLAEQAEPVSEIQTALEKLQLLQQQQGSSTISMPPKVDTQSELQSPRKRSNNDSDTSPKRLKIESGFMKPEAELSKKQQTALPEQIPSTQPSAHSASLNAAKLSTIPVNVALTVSSSLKVAGAKMPDFKPPASRVRPSRLLSSRLGPKGLSGRAKRVEPENSVVEDSESEQESQGEGGDTTTTTTKALGPESACNTSSITGPKIKKLDLGYMWEWDPSARSGKTQELKTANGKPKERGLDRIEEATSSSGQTTSASSHRSGDSTTNTASSVASRKSTTSNNNNKDTSSVNHKDNNPDGGSATKSPPVSTPEEDAVTQPPRAEELSVSTPAVVEPRQSAPHDDMLARVNREFLPLVHENNIVQVNGSSYAKLGVIGKGGSCKVYRALSKKCAVVAIKKVKLEGMDKKAIEGYANEISLLKRLRGNPAIIQMYDAEVDLERKSIFVVLELGEADLNHILQQRALSGQSRSLNMNFIRLTWQQMLSAVHAIHEERIIHSDLKPANFLFVRGALKLIDFGIAKAIQSDDTTNIYRESHIGTLNYMSPEAILDTETGTNGPRMRIGRASDVWSLGCILYEMVHGKTPFANLHFIQKLQAIVNPNHPIPISDEVDDASADCIRQCLQRNPEDRPPIVGKMGLLNEHRFLHSSKKST